MSTRQYGIEGWGIDLKAMNISVEKIAQEKDISLEEAQEIIDNGNYDELVDEAIEIAFAETTVYFIMYPNLPWEYYWNMDLKNIATENDAKQYFWERLGCYCNLTEKEFKNSCDRISDLTY